MIWFQDLGVGSGCYQNLRREQIKSDLNLSGHRLHSSTCNNLYDHLSSQVAPTILHMHAQTIFSLREDTPPEIVVGIHKCIYPQNLNVLK